MKVNTSRFGTLEIDDKSVIRMPKGPLGFEDKTGFCLIEHRPDTCFRWLQSTEDPALAFVVVDPSQFFANYEVEISDADAEELKLDGPEDAMVLSIVSVQGGGSEITANLAAPLIINSKELCAMQIVMQDDRYGVRHKIRQRVENRSKENVEVKAA